MPAAVKSAYQAHEFAALAGVTVRTLHYYDRLGLLKPSGHTASGYRLYREQDLPRLQQIVTLKFIGCSLAQIKALLDRTELDLATMLRLQCEGLRARRQLDAAIAAVERAERVVTEGNEPPAAALRSAIEAITMQRDMEWVKRYYSDEQLASLATRWSPDVQAAAERDWTALIAAVEAAAHEGVAPGGERGRALAARWSALIGAFTGGDPAIAENLQRLYADQANWPATFKKPCSDAAEDFINEAQAAGRDQ